MSIFCWQCNMWHRNVTLLVSKTGTVCSSRDICSCKLPNFLHIIFFTPFKNNFEPTTENFLVDLLYKFSTLIWHFIAYFSLNFGVFKSHVNESSTIILLKDFIKYLVTSASYGLEIFLYTIFFSKVCLLKGF